MQAKQLIMLTILSLINLSILCSSHHQNNLNNSHASQQNIPEQIPNADSSSTYALRNAITQFIIDNPNFSDDIKKEWVNSSRKKPTQSENQSTQSQPNYSRS